MRRRLSPPQRALPTNLSDLKGRSLVQTYTVTHTQHTHPLIHEQHTQREHTGAALSRQCIICSESLFKVINRSLVSFLSCSITAAQKWTGGDRLTCLGHSDGTNLTCQGWFLVSQTVCLDSWLAVCLFGPGS